VKRYKVLYGKDGELEKEFSNYKKALRFVKIRARRLPVIGIFGPEGI